MFEPLERRPRLAELAVQIGPQMVVGGRRDAERWVNLAGGVAEGKQSGRPEFTKEGLRQVVLSPFRIYQNISGFVLQVEGNFRPLLVGFFPRFLIVPLYLLFHFHFVVIARDLR